jgi:hypothetical protein
MFQNATITVEPGIGHYLFEHLDRNGHNVVLRELLAVDGETPANSKKLIDDVLNFITSIDTHKYIKFVGD